MDPTDNDSATANYDFESPINQAEDEGAWNNDGTFPFRFCFIVTMLA